jgi:IS605 OrfB family transposase
MLLTVPIKLLATPEQKIQLLALMHKFNEACNWLSELAFENGVFKQFDLHDAFYYELCSRFDLKSQLAIRIIGRVADSYKLNKQIQHSFKKTSSVELDEHLLNWKQLSTVSITSLDGRLNIPIAFSNRINLKAKLKKDMIKGSAKLVLKKGEFYLQAAVEMPEASPKKAKSFLGVDMGIVNLATTSLGENYSGAEVDANRIRINSLRGRLQRCGSKSAKRHLKKLSGKERAFKRNANHVISKKIVQSAQRHRKSIALEELKGFRKTVIKSQRERFGKWSFFELATFITYKAKLKGIEVVKVDPRMTSRMCSQCKHCEKNNRPSRDIFKCKSCGFTEAADFNAAINIAARAFINRLIAAGDKSPSSKLTLKKR